MNSLLMVQITMIQRSPFGFIFKLLKINLCKEVFTLALKFLHSPKKNEFVGDIMRVDQLRKRSTQWQNNFFLKFSFLLV